MVGYYDIHTHFLPGVDDGAATMAETRKLLKLEYKHGVRNIFVTPHFRRGMFHCPMEKIQAQYEAVKKEAEEIGSDFRVLLGCEFHVNTDMVATLDRGERPLMGASRCVLTEFSEGEKFEKILRKCQELVRQGYRPVVAHAERCEELQDLDALEELVEIGAYIQMNADSIIGKDGFRMKRFCKKVMQNDLLHFVGSDGHNMKKRKPAMGKCSKYIEKVMGRVYMKKILIENPRRILDPGAKRKVRRAQ